MKYQPIKKSQPNLPWIWILVAFMLIAGIVLLVNAMRGSGSEAAVSEDAVNAVYTNVANTFAAGGDPTATVSVPTSPPAEIPTSTETLPPLASPTSAGIPTLAATSAPAVNLNCYNAVFASDVTIPDKTEVKPGEVFTKTWKIVNNGTCPWEAGYKLKFVFGEEMKGEAIPINITVEPGRIIDVSVKFTAPTDKTGEITSKWAMSNAQGQSFGDHFYVIIKVGTTGDEPTSTGEVIAPSETPTTSP